MSNALVRETKRSTTGLRMTIDEFYTLPGDGTGRIYELVHGEAGTSPSPSRHAV